jgi:hypothetical protein
MFKKMFVGFLQGSRISFYDQVEKDIRRNLASGTWSLEGVGHGVRRTISETQKRIPGSAWYTELIADPFEIETNCAWECEGVALEGAKQGKEMAREGWMIGGQLVASIYGLRAIAGGEVRSVAERARAAFPPKLDLANKSLIAARAEVAGWVAKS